MSEPARQDVAPRRSADVVAVTGATMMDVIARAAADPNTDVEKLERLLAMAERVKAQEAKAAYTRDLAAMQPKMPVIDEHGAIRNTAGTVQSTYAKWEDINAVIQPILSEHGFTLSFRPGMAQDGKITVTTVLAHRDGHQDEATVTLPHDSSGSKNGVQAVGSSFTYAKRYGAIGLLNITSRAPQDRDDDGKSGGMSAAGRDAITEINMAEGLEGLRAWRAKDFDRLSKELPAEEMREIVALWNLRRKRAIEAQQAASDFPGDRK
jgi:hypothetical protein